MQISVKGFFFPHHKTALSSLSARWSPFISRRAPLPCRRFLRFPSFTFPAQEGNRRRLRTGYFPACTRKLALRDGHASSTGVRCLAAVRIFQLKKRGERRAVRDGRGSERTPVNLFLKLIPPTLDRLLWYTGMSFCKDVYRRSLAPSPKSPHHSSKRYKCLGSANNFLGVRTKLAIVLSES